VADSGNLLTIQIRYLQSDLTAPLGLLQSADPAMSLSLEVDPTRKLRTGSRGLGWGCCDVSGFGGRSTSR
jgi:hypothetical protein